MRYEVMRCGIRMKQSEEALHGYGKQAIERYPTNVFWSYDSPMRFYRA